MTDRKLTRAELDRIFVHDDVETYASQQARHRANFERLKRERLEREESGESW